LTDGSRSGFVHARQCGSLLVDDDADRLLDRLAAWRAPATPRPWLRVDET
jgi:hypothetical protein